MIIERLSLHNFGVYRGRHEIELAPPDPDHPVVLIGGLNGGGKTTILDAIQLALYGTRARATDRDRYPYDEFLRRAIHRDVPPSEGAAIELVFSVRLDGIPTRMAIRRRWQESGRSIRESVEVSRNDRHDPVLTEVWSDYVEEFFPLEISQLFFFDGERIEALASPEQSSTLVETAINSLLGVDLIEQLEADLITLERRQRSKLDTSKETGELDDAQRRVDHAEQERVELLQERALQQGAVDATKLTKQRADGAFRRAGGELYEARESLETDHGQRRRDLEDVAESLREAAAGVLPLALTGELLVGITNQGRSERGARLAQAIAEALDRHDTTLIRWSEQHSPEVRESLAKELELFRRDRLNDELPPDPYLHLSDDAAARLSVLAESGIPQAMTDTTLSLDRFHQAQAALTDAERRLSAVPDAAAVANAFEQRRAAIAALEQSERSLMATDTLLERFNAQVETARRDLSTILERRAQDDFAFDGAHRIIDHARRARARLEALRERVIDEDVHRIEDAVTEAFTTLMRKERLVERVRFVRPSYQVELLASGGQRVRSDELSAGERQLLAVAMLWGLASVSGKELPTVIDTPLGRLDSIHRERLVTRYFPHAGNQVILLSTDEEVDEPLLELLAPYLGRNYRLDYDEESRSSSIVKGYFHFEALANAD